jgi:hypothetical protein
MEVHEVKGTTIKVYIFEKYFLRRVQWCTPFARKTIGRESKTGSKVPLFTYK